MCIRDSASHDGIFEGTMELYVHNAEDLNKMLENLRRIRSMNKVTRIEENLEES